MDMFIDKTLNILFLKEIESDLGTEKGVEGSVCPVASHHSLCQWLYSDLFLMFMWFLPLNKPE